MATYLRTARGESRRDGDPRQHFQTCGKCLVTREIERECLFPHVFGYSVRVTEAAERAHEMIWRRVDLTITREKLVHEQVHACCFPSGTCFAHWYSAL